MTVISLRSDKWHVPLVSWIISGVCLHCKQVVIKIKILCGVGVTFTILLSEWGLKCYETLSAPIKIFIEHIPHLFSAIRLDYLIYMYT